MAGGQGKEGEKREAEQKKPEGECKAYTRMEVMVIGECARSVNMDLRPTRGKKVLAVRGSMDKARFCVTNK